jgi:hypothetical protein
MIRNALFSRRALTVWLTAAAMAPAMALTVGSGVAVTEPRPVSGFQAIALRGAIDLVVRQAPREGVQVHADDNVVPLVQTEIDAGGDVRTLRIQLKPGASVRTKTPVVVTVDVVKLSAVASSGSGDIRVEALHTPALTLSSSGSSEIRLEQLDTEQLGVSIAGSSNVQARGRAARLDVSISGSGDVQARELAAGEVKVSISGSGDASLTALRTLSVAIAGSGNVEYGGSATLATSRVVGSGSVRRRQP